MYGRHLYIKSLGCVRRLIVSVRRSSSGREEILYLLTNRTDHMDAILGHYTLRWKIECFHKDAKQHLGVGRLQARSVVGIRRNWYLVFLAHALLRLGVSESSFGRTLIRSTGRKARKVCLDLLEDFISWVITTCNECGDQNKLHEIMEVFINR